MTHLEQLKGLLTDAGVEFTEKDAADYGRAGTRIKIGGYGKLYNEPLAGYNGFFNAIFFDPSGKMIEWGIWE